MKDLEVSFSSFLFISWMIGCKRITKKLASFFAKVCVYCRKHTSILHIYYHLAIVQLLLQVVSRKWGFEAKMDKKVTKNLIFLIPSASTASKPWLISNSFIFCFTITQSDLSLRKNIPNYDWALSCYFINIEEKMSFCPYPISLKYLTDVSNYHHSVLLG